MYASASIVSVALAARFLLRRSRFVSLRGKVVVITGGSRGLGLNIARVCVERGANVAICARNADQLASAEIELRQQGGTILAKLVDVTDRDALLRFIDDVVARFGAIDFLINNAGLIQVGPFVEMDEAAFDAGIATHFYAPLHAILMTLPHMRHAGGGRIVNIASIGGKQPVPHMLPYTASKHALVGLSEGLRVELARENIFVTTVIPGLFRSGSVRNAQFRGQNEKEHAWFAVGDAMPGVSMNVRRLARQIVDAAQHGDAELVTPALAKVQASIAATFPNLTAELSQLINVLLPAPGGIGRRQLPGSASESSMTPGFAQSLNDQAARANNEM